MNIFNDLPEITKEYFQTGCINNYFIKFLKEQDIKRIELDNLLQGIRLDNIKDMDVSLYLPYGYITTSRYCFSNFNNRKKGRAIGIYPCEKECQRCYFVLRNNTMTVPLFLKGNTIFFENKIWQLLDNKGIVNRIIYQQNIPI